MSSGERQHTKALRQRAARRCWLHVALMLVFLAVGMPGGHAMAGVDAPAHASAMAGCDGCGGLADAGAACTASLSQLPAALAVAVLPVTAPGVCAPAPSPASRYRSPDLDAPRQPPRPA